MNRRSFLAFSTTALLTACRKPYGETGVVRIGFLANLTHAPMIVALASQAIAKALPGVKIETRTFRAGPRVCEALLGNAIDIATTGPAPIVSMHARHSGNPLVILSGVASGGASLIALPSIKSAADLAGKRVATPQIGSTQDISLRKWLTKNGLVTKERGGDVTVDALASANIMEEMRRGSIAASWMPEPWASRVINEKIAHRMIDERDIWAEHRFPTALLVARRPFFEVRGVEAKAIRAAVQEQIAKPNKELTFAEIKRLTGKGLPKPVVDAAWPRVDYLTDPLPKELAEIAADSQALGYMPKTDVSGLFV
jgi:NitT/TauT family transport system substrate-binding protein